MKSLVKNKAILKISSVCKLSGRKKNTLSYFILLCEIIYHLLWCILQAGDYGVILLFVTVAIIYPWSQHCNWVGPTVYMILDGKQKMIFIGLNIYWLLKWTVVTPTDVNFWKYHFYGIWVIETWIFFHKYLTNISRYVLHDL